MNRLDHSQPKRGSIPFTRSLKSPRLKLNYVSTTLTRSFKDLEWHKEKNHQHRRLNLLPRSLPASQSQSSARSCEPSFKARRLVPACTRLACKSPPEINGASLFVWRMGLSAPTANN